MPSRASSASEPSIEQLARMIVAAPEGWLARHLNEVDADISVAMEMLIELASDPQVDRKTRDCATAAVNILVEEHNARFRLIVDDD